MHLSTLCVHPTIWSSSSPMRVCLDADSPAPACRFPTKSVHGPDHVVSLDDVQRADCTRILTPHLDPLGLVRGNVVEGYLANRQSVVYGDS
jgi:hypothetical protein